MQSLPDARQQTFEEIYGPPENFLEIEVCVPKAPRTAGLIDLAELSTSFQFHNTATPNISITYFSPDMPYPQ